jgi:hypothetical protein
MESPQSTLSPAAAVAVGTLFVNVPNVAIIISVTVVGIRAGLNPFVALFAACSVAWIWWSLTVPVWRLWAYRRVASTGTLQKWALAVGLVWPKGFFLERTEIKSWAHRQQELDFEQRRP